MFTQQEQQQIEQLRQNCTVKRETNIKEVEGGFLITNTEFFVSDVNGVHTVVAQTQSTLIRTTGAGVATAIATIYAPDALVDAPLTTPAIDMIEADDETKAVN